MKRVFLTATAILAMIRLSAQQDSTAYKSKTLKLEEVNLISSYYSQNGNNAAVTGGVGDQKLSDIANVFELRFVRYDKHQRKNTLDAELGIDHYTSASSDKIDLKANTSASYSDSRIYPSLSYSIENEQKGTTLSMGLSSSTEFDYQSFGGNISYSKKFFEKSGELTAKAQVYLDQVKLILPIELRSRSSEAEGSGYSGRNTFAGSLSYTQIINPSLEVAFLADVVQQQGFLSLPFYRVYFNDGSVHQEKLPDRRFKLPLGFRANYFAGDRVIIRSYYRYYTDNWGVRSHTASLEVPFKITPFVSVSPFYRYYRQTGADYFAGYGAHSSQDAFYTSNYDLSTFHSSFAGAGFRMAPPRGVLGIQHFSSLEIRYGHYTKNIGLRSNIISLNLGFK